jgi:hypothetical protein
MHEVAAISPEKLMNAKTNTSHWVKHKSDFDVK